MKHTSRYKCVHLLWAVCESITATSYFSATLFYFYAAGLDPDLNAKWVSIKVPFPKTEEK